MGTRGALGFRVNGTDKVTYNHFDSYPGGLGESVIEEVKTFTDEQFRETAERLVLVNDGDTVPKELQVRYAANTNLGVASQDAGDWYCVLREIQGQLAPYVVGGVDHMIDSSGFLLNSLFCEWAYIINVDEGTLEVYKGFNQSDGGAGRYASLNGGNGYNGVYLIDTLSLDDVRQANAGNLTEKWDPPYDYDEED